MSVFIYPPTTYNEWLNAFNHFKELELTEDDANILRQGKLENDPYVVNLFQKQLVGFLNFAISNKLKRFNKDINFMIEINDYIGISKIMKKLKKDLLNLTFYKYLEFVGKETRNNFSNQICAELIKYFKDLALYFEINGRSNKEYVNVLYDMNKLSFGEIFKVSE